MQNFENKKLSDKVTEKLLYMIQVQRVFKPGQQLPNEIELAEQLGVSRTTLREAENQLVAMNILTKTRGKGTFVTEPGEREEPKEFDNLNYKHSRLSDLYNLRMMMEPPLAGLAAVKATEDELIHIEELSNQLAQDDITCEKVVELNRRFHSAIANATHNELIVKTFERVNDAIVQYFDKENLEMLNSEDVIRSHSLIVQYMKLRDQIGTRKAMELHLRDSIQDYDIDSTI